LGSLCTGTLADKKGRKLACLAGAFCIALGGLIMTLAPSFATLVAGRCVEYAYAKPSSLLTSPFRLVIGIGN
jgi:MFS family permease